MRYLLLAQIIRMWDPRTKAKLGQLKGHTDNIKCLAVSNDGSKCLSGSAGKNLVVMRDEV